MSKEKLPPPHARKIFIVEDHPAFREGLVQIVNGEQDLSVCGEAGDSESALKEIRRLKPDLVLVDISLPGKSGLDLIRAIRLNDKKVKLLVVSMHDEAFYACRVLRAGGDGYIMKQQDPSELLSAIHDVLEGNIYVSEAVMETMSDKDATARVVDPIDQLSDGELEILDLLGRGESNEEIAEHRNLDPATVEAGCETIRRKLNLKSNNALIHYAVCWAQKDSSPN